jgi:Sec-independent protein translocase protein TatA
MSQSSIWYWIVIVAVAILRFSGGSFFRRD